MKKMFKKILIYICSLSLAYAAVPAAYADAVRVEIGSSTVAQSSGTQSVQIPVSISDNNGIAGMTLTVSYTEGLTLTDISRGSALSSLTFTKPGDFSANPFNMVWDGVDADNTDGVIAVLTFTVPAGEVKDYYITAVTDAVVDNDLNEVNVFVTSGKISVTGCAIASVDIESESGLSCEVHLVSDDTIEGYVFAALYDSDNRLISIKRKNAAETVTADFGDIESAAQIKVFWWDSLSSLKPKAHTKYIRIR